MKRWVEATVVILKCAACRATNPHLVLAGDTDMATDGLLCLTSVEHNEVVVADDEGREPADLPGCDIAGRINRAMGRDDLRFIRLVGVVETPARPGQGFQAFRESFQPPRRRYSCPVCGAGMSEVIRELSPSQFALEGGRITPFGELEVRG